jgi:hypothetical protein
MKRGCGVFVLSFDYFFISGNLYINKEDGVFYLEKYSDNESVEG